MYQKTRRIQHFLQAKAQSLFSNEIGQEIHRCLIAISIDPLYLRHEVHVISRPIPRN